MEYKPPKNFLSAYRKGRVAYHEKGEDAKCPYKDIKCGCHDHIPTYSKSFIRFWREGLEDAKSKKPSRY